MSKYIDADRLKEKIYAEDTVSLAHGSLPEFDQGCHYAFLTVLSFLDSLQQEQPDVDLEKEIQEYLEKLGGGHGGFVDDLTDDDLMGFALHFYELGIIQERKNNINLIDKDAIVAEIRKRIQEHLDAGGATRGVYLSERMKEDSYFLSLIDTLGISKKIDKE